MEEKIELTEEQKQQLEKAIKESLEIIDNMEAKASAQNGIDEDDLLRLLKKAENKLQQIVQYGPTIPILDEPGSSIALDKYIYENILKELRAIISEMKILKKNSALAEETNRLIELLDEIETKFF